MQTWVNKKTVVSNCLLFRLDSTGCVRAYEPVLGMVWYVCYMRHCREFITKQKYSSMCHILFEEMCAIGTYTIGCDCALGNIRSKWLQQYDEIWLHINGSNYKPTACSIQRWTTTATLYMPQHTQRWSRSWNCNRCHWNEIGHTLHTIYMKSWRRTKVEELKKAWQKQRIIILQSSNTLTESLSIRRRLVWCVHCSEMMNNSNEMISTY